MYATLAFQIVSGPSPVSDVEAAVRATIPANRTTCALVDNVLIFRVRAGNEVGEYFDALDALGQVVNRFPNQLRFALQLTDDHFLEGHGFDAQTAAQITA